MLAKLIVTGPTEPPRWMSHFGAGALPGSGLETTVPFHARAGQPEFARAEVHTRWVEEKFQMAMH